MKFSTFTTWAITAFTNRHCIRFTEMAYVIVAVFESGRPQFISKDKLHRFVVRRECRNDGKLQAEWTIGRLAGQQAPSSGASAEVLVKRLGRAGFVCAQIENGKAIALLPDDEFDARIARQVAKEEGWQISGNVVCA